MELNASVILIILDQPVKYVPRILIFSKMILKVCIPTILLQFLCILYATDQVF